MLSTLRKPDLVRIYLIPLITMLVSSMTWSISIVYYLELGATVTQVNMLRSIRTLMGTLLLVPMGALSDKYGRKYMVLYSRTVNLLGVTIHAYAQNLRHLYLASIVNGVAGRGFFPVLLSMIGDTATEEESQEAVSLLYLASSIGLITGPTITSLILDKELTNLRGVYQIGVITQVTVLIYLATQIKETTTIDKQSKPSIDQLKTLLTQKTYQNLSLMAILYYFSRSTIETYTPIYAKTSLDYTDAQIALLSTIRSTGILVIRLLSATILTQTHFQTLLYMFLALGGVAGLTAYIANSYTTIALAIILSGISYGSIRILGATLIAKQTTTRNRGLANSLYNVAISTGDITRTLTAPIVELVGIKPVFLLATISALTSTIPAKKLRNKENT